MQRVSRLRSIVVALVALVALAALGAIGCGKSKGAVTMNGDDQVLTILIYSGREQPPPQTKNVRVDAPVSIQLVGIGPPKADVFGPDGAPVETVESRMIEDSGFSGTRLRFTPHAPGIYRVESRSAVGFVYARINAS